MVNLARNNMLMHKNVKTTTSIKLDNGKTIRKGTRGAIVIDYKDGTFQFESNNGVDAFKVHEGEYETI